ncbi:uncharacterized protein [Panulirus ornatus]|uniref:uncharacterized protein isoform X2 n=1 Tax=Panulirus ornatus TaxID=150431 RepID=UPI003A889DCF
MLVQRFLAWAIILLQLRQGCCVCYFPGELHGVWETQVTTGRGGRSSRPPTIHYQNITIHSDLIVQWGFCHTRIDNDIILSDRTGSSECFRCVRVDMVSPSLVQVWTTGLETCYTTEDAALRTCPAPADRASRRASQIMLYRIKSSWDEREVEGCPLIGRYTFTYRRGSNGVTAASCDQPTSEFSNCPYGFGFNVIYRDCSFPTPERRGLQCLGSWVGEDQNNYLAVWESSVNDANDNLPRYKCGMFREEAGTGRILLALSEDSTCTNGLSSPADGYETYVMTSVPSPPLPPDVSASTCTFPRTLLGHWHHTFVADNTIIFKDYLHYMTYSASCVRDMDDGERYIVYTRTHCGDWKYNCLWLKRRSANVLEFMLGLYPRETFDLSLCDADKFGDMTSWITQGKSLLEEPTTCPIVGTYAGQLPDASGICAQLYSDCDSPEIMYYTVSACRNASTVYEREDLPGPTSEAGPWLPAEQKVSTGAVLTIVEDQDWRRQRQVKSDDFPVDNSRTSTFSWRLGNVSTIVDDRGARKRRHASGGQFRVANARTTTISWLWGTTPSPYTTSSTASTTTSTTTTRPSTTVDSGWSSLPVSRPPGPYAGPSSERNYNRHDPYIETPRRQEPPRRDGYNPIGFWPSSQTQRNNQPADVTPATPVVGRGPVRHYAPTEDTPAPPAVGRGPIRHYPPAEDTPAPPVVGRGSVRLRSNTTSDSGESGVPGRATWVPGAPPGFQPLTSTQQPVVSDTLPRESLEDNPHPAVVPSPPRNTDYNYYNPAGGTNRQPLKQSGHSQRPVKQEREYQCLGQWEEEGRVYALTYRRDIHTYECFVGVIKTDGVVFIKEAGARCSRGVQPVILGMKLHRKASCTPKSTPTRASQSSQRNRTRPPATSPPWLHTTKPWKPITAVESQALVTCKVGDTCAGLDDKHSASLSTLSRLTERTKKGRHALGDVNNYNAGDSSQSHISTIQKNYMMTRLLNSINDEAKEQKIPSSKDSLDHGKLHYPLLKHEFQIPLTHSKREASHRAPQRVRRDADEEQEVMIDTDTSESMIITVRGYVRRARENSMMNRALGNGQSYEARKVSISQGTHADPGHKRETYAPHQCDNCSVQASAPQNSREERDIPVKIYHEVDHSHGHNTTSALAKSTFLVLPVTDVPPPVPGVTMLIVHDSTTHAHDPDHMPPGSGNTHHNGTNNGIGNTHHNGADHGTGNIHHNGTDHGTGNTQHNGGDHGTGNIHHNGAGHGTGNIHHNGTDHGTGNTQHNGTDHGTGNTHHNGADHGTGNTHHNGTDHGTGNTQHNGADHGTGNTQHNGTDHGTGNIHHNGADHETGNTHYNGTDYGIGNAHRSGADHGTGNTQHSGADHGTGNTQYNGGDHGTGNTQHNGADHGTGNIYHNGTDHGTGHIHHNGADHGTGNTHHNGADHGTGHIHHNGADHGTGNTHHNGADHGTGNTHHNGADHGTGHIHHNGADHGTGNTHHNGADHGTGNTHHNGADHGTGNTHHNGADHGTGNTHHNGANYGTRNTHHNGGDHETGNIHHNGADHGTRNTHHNGGDHETGNIHHNIADHGTGSIHHNSADLGTENTHHSGNDHGVSDRHSYDIGGDHGPSSTHEIPADRRGRDGTNYHTDNDRNIVGSRVNKSNPHSDADYEVQAGDVNNNGTDHEVQALNDHHHSTDHDETDNTQLQDKPLHKLSHINNTGDEDNLNDYSEDRFNKGESASVKDQTINSGDELYQNFNSSIKSSEKAGENIPKTTSTHIREINGSLSGSTSVLGYTGDFLSTESSTKNHEISKPKIYFLPRTTYLVDKEAMVTHSYNLEIDSENQTHKLTSNQTGTQWSHLTGVHENVTNKDIMMSENDHTDIVLRSEDTSSYEKNKINMSNITLNCISIIDNNNLNMTENVTKFNSFTNCSENWTIQHDSIVETPTSWTTEDNSDIPKIPISLIEYPTHPHTTVKPFIVTLPALVWQPLGEPGRPSHRGSGCEGLLVTSNLLLLSTLALNLLT